MMKHEDLIVAKEAPPKRQGKARGDHEEHFYEGAVMLVYAMHLFATEGAQTVSVYPDGEHGKQFDFAAWLKRRGFEKTQSAGKTTYGGTYTDAHGRKVVVQPKSGLGDVVAEVGGVRILAECKGGVVNSTHAGQVSRLRRGLYEAVGLLMAKDPRDRLVAVVPLTPTTLEMAKKLAPRCAAAGIQIALIDKTGRVLAPEPTS